MNNPALEYIAKEESRLQQLLSNTENREENRQKLAEAEREISRLKNDQSRSGKRHLHDLRHKAEKLREKIGQADDINVLALKSALQKLQSYRPVINEALHHRELLNQALDKLPHDLRQAFYGR